MKNCIFIALKIFTHNSTSLRSFYYSSWAMWLTHTHTHTMYIYVRVHKPVIITLLNAVDGIVDSCAAIQSVHWALCLGVGRGGVGGMGVCQVVELVALVQLLRWKTGVVLWGDGSPVVRVRYGGNGFLGEAP